MAFLSGLNFLLFSVGEVPCSSNYK